MAKIFSVGMGQRRQAAMREDGQWFERTRLPSKRWGPWEAVREKPANTWFNAMRAVQDTELPPLEMLLRCPECGKFHIDKGELSQQPHKIHECEFCKHMWQPKPCNTFGI